MIESDQPNIWVNNPDAPAPASVAPQEEWLICGQSISDYLDYQFPATEGHIPLRDWLDKVASRLREDKKEIERLRREHGEMEAALRTLIHAVNTHLLCGRPEIKTVNDVIEGMREVARKMSDVAQPSNAEKVASLSAQLTVSREALEKICGQTNPGEWEHEFAVSTLRSLDKRGCVSTDDSSPTEPSSIPEHGDVIP